jgi:dipeptidyl aminopeptidase/acylaminoacyl peptidase
MKKIVVALLLVTCFFQGKAQKDKGMMPLDVAKIKMVADVKISDDGKNIAYMLMNPADPLKENKPANVELYVHRIDENQNVPFITRNRISDVSFRPGHSTITFLATLDDEKNRSLYEIPLSGGEAVKIFSHATPLAGYSWSPDGNKLAFIAAENKDNNGEEMEEKLPYQPKIYEEDLTFHYAWVVSPDDWNNLKKINVTGHYYDVQWSPDGSKLAVAIAPTPLIDDWYMKQSVHIVDATTLNETGSVNHQGKLAKMAFNPDGTKLAFIGGADIHDPIAGRLFVVSSKGGNPESLRPDYEGKFESFDWSDSQTIRFISSEGVWSAYGTIKSNGSDWQRKRLEDGPVLYGFDVSENGTFVYAADTPEHPREVYMMNEGENTPRRVTFHNEWLEDVALGEQEVVRYKAGDGLEIQGLLIKPINYSEGQRYPLITVVHGGPEAHYSNGWLTNYSTVGQMGAALGYAVFFPNYRGSTGRGEEFIKSSQADMAGKEFDDIVDGVDFLIEQGIADKDKVGVTGGSYGGYATGWFATRYTDRFAAGVMFVGISNNISKWGTGDIPEELYLVHARQRIWEDYDFFLERSPIYYAGQAKTPLLIMTGEDDTRVHPSQSIELYRHIKTRTDTPVRLVLYPGEGHGNRNSTARFDYTLRQLRWFEKYLKDKPIEMKTSVSPDIIN